MSSHTKKHSLVKKMTYLHALQQNKQIKAKEKPV